MKKAVKLFLITNGIILILQSMLLLIKPSAFRITACITPESPNLVEIMTLYGGLKLGLGFFSFWSAFNTKRYKIALSIFTFIYFITEITKLIGIIQYGDKDLNKLIAMAAKVVCAFSAFYINKVIFYSKRRIEAPNF